MTGFPRIERVRRGVRRSRGFTLLEMIVATTIMAVAVVGLLAGLASSTRNAARLLDYDRAVQLARLRMNDLLLDQRFPLNMPVEGRFDPAVTSGGWRPAGARASPPLEMPPAPAARADQHPARGARSVVEQRHESAQFHAGGLPVRHVRARRTFPVQAVPQ